MINEPDPVFFTSYCFLFLITSSADHKHDSQLSGNKLSINREHHDPYKRVRTMKRS